MRCKYWYFRDDKVLPSSKYWLGYQVRWTETIIYFYFSSAELIYDFLLFAVYEKITSQFLDQELIPYRYSFCSSCSSWGKSFQKSPKAPSFQIRSGWNWAGLFFK